MAGEGEVQCARREWALFDVSARVRGQLQDSEKSNRKFPSVRGTHLGMAVLVMRMIRLAETD
jgi:hypothetical protein